MVSSIGMESHGWELLRGKKDSILLNFWWKEWEEVIFGNVAIAAEHLKVIST